MTAVDEGKFEFRVAGNCPVCDGETEFVALRDSPIAEKWYGHWFRNTLKCVRCGSLPRERALFVVLEMMFPAWRQLTIHESSPVARGVSRKFADECPGYVVSHYDPAVPFGETHPRQRYRSEDLQNQTFETGSFDLVITQDVFEHLFEPDRAIREIARTLKSGGAHILTVPIVRGSKSSRRRARIGESGEVEFLLEPQYHGNPISNQGSLVTIDWGYDIINYLAAYSDLSISMFYIDDITRGIRAALIEVLMCRKMAHAPTVL